MQGWLAEAAHRFPLPLKPRRSDRRGPWEEGRRILVWKGPAGCPAFADSDQTCRNWPRRQSRAINEGSSVELEAATWAWEAAGCPPEFQTAVLSSSEDDFRQFRECGRTVARSCA